VTIYESDLAAWAIEQADALRTRSTNKLDWGNLADEIDGVAASQKRELRSRLKVLLQHLLKWQLQPEYQSRSWRATLRTQREEIDDLLEDSPSLRSYPATVLDRAYIAARIRAEDETGLVRLPDACPWTIQQVLNYNFLPGA
jgi:hypothetical protein